MINIAKLLKDAPKGTKLYSPLFGEVKLDDAGGMIYVTTKYGSSKCFTETGCYYVDNETFSTECLLFPSKDCRTWEGWKPPVKPKFKVGDWVVYCGKIYQITNIGETLYTYTSLKTGSFFFNKIETTDNSGATRLWTIQDAKDGDVLALNGKPFIYSDKYEKNYCYIDNCGQFRVNFSLVLEGNCVHPATKEQRDLLFKKMREVGYTWDENKKELKKIPKHYDISNLKPFDKVLVRQNDSCTWGVSFFGRYSEMFMCCNNVCFKQCIPLNDDTKHLFGTTDMCDEQYINW